MAKGLSLFKIPSKTVGIGMALAALVIVLTALYSFVPASHKGTVVFFGAGLAAAGALAGAFYTGRILEFHLEREERILSEAAARAEEARQEAAERKSEAKREAAFRYGERWNHPGMFYSRKLCRDIIKKRRTPNAIRDQVIADSDAEVNVNHVLNFLDELALSVREGRCNEEITKRQFAGVIQNVYQAVSSYRTHVVQDLGREQAWAELRWLYERWSAPN